MQTNISVNHKKHWNFASSNKKTISYFVVKTKSKQVNIKNGL